MMPFKFETLFDEEFTKGFAGFTNFPFFEVEAMLDIQRKNIEAMTEAHRLVCEGFQAVARRQTEIVSQMAKDNSSLLKEIVNEGTPEQKAALQADLAKKIYENSIANCRDLTEIISKSGKEATAVINDRVSSSLTELKSALEKQTTGPKVSTRKKAA